MWLTRRNECSTNIFGHTVIKVHFDMTLIFDLEDHNYMHFIPYG